MHSLDMDDANPFLNPTPLPSPGNDIEEHSTGERPRIHQNAQYDLNGDLLFFVQDGIVYDHEGYVIANVDERYISGNEPEEWAGDAGGIHYFNQPDMIISPVPGSCYLFYLLFNHLDQNSDEFHLYGYILDMMEDNPLFNDPIRKGRMVGDDNVSLYPQFSLIDFDPFLSNSLIDFYSFSQSETEKDLVFMELMDADTNQYKTLFLASGSTVRSFNVTDSTIVLIDTYEADECDIFIERSQIPQGQSSLPQRMRGGEMDVIYSFTLEQHLLAFNDAIIYNGTTPWQSIKVLTLDSVGGILGSLTCIEGPQTYIKGLEFSNNGRYLYSIGDGTTENLGIYDLLNEVSLTASPLFSYFENNTQYGYSRMSKGNYQGEEVIYLQGFNGQIAVIRDIDDPATAFVEVVTTIPSLQKSQYEVALTIDGFTPNNTDPDEVGFYFFCEQNFNGTQILDYLASEACCLENTIINDITFDSYTATGTETWTSFDNPWSSLGVTDPICINELRFAPGSHITIQGMKISFAEGALADIRTGAHVTLVNSVLTSLCGSMWDGVIVRGNATLPQSPISNQGYLEVLSNSTIENALVGVSVNGGGIIESQQSLFLNNKLGLRFNSYSNLTPNASIIGATDFEWSSQLNIPVDQFDKHVSMTFVQGIIMDKCNFINNSSFTEFPYDKRGVGVWAYSSNFTVSGDNSGEAGRFITLWGGIDAGYGNWNYGFSCTDMDFLETYQGIRVAGGILANIMFNDFILPENINALNTNINTWPFGVWLLNSDQFTFEENHLSEVSPGERSSIGVIIQNTGDFNENQIHRNWYDGHYIGTLVHQDNGGDENEPGLQVTCQHYTDCYRDINLIYAASWRRQQGSPLAIETLTNNKFSSDYSWVVPYIYSDLSVSAAYGENIQLSPPLTFDYLTQDEAETFPDFTIDHLNTVVVGPFENDIFDFDQHCLAINGFQGGGEAGQALYASQMEVEAEQEVIAQEREFLQAARLLFHSVVDQGDPEELIAQINNANPMESAALRNLLLSKYPLSKEVMTEMVRRTEPMDPWHLTQVLIANAPIEKEVMLTLEEYAILSPFFMNYVHQANETGLSNIKHLLSDEIYSRSTLIHQKQSRVSNHLLNSAAEGPLFEEFRAFASNQDEPWAAAFLADIALMEGDDQAVRSYMNERWTSDDPQWQWWDLKLRAEGLPENLSEIDVDYLWQVYLDDDSDFNGSALAMLHALGFEEEWPTVILEEPGRSAQSDGSGIQGSGARSIMDESLISVYPNPAQDLLYLSYPPEADGLATLEIMDTQGRTVLKIDLDSHGIVELDVEQWQRGVYIARLLSDAILQGECRILLR